MKLNFRLTTRLSVMVLLAVMVTISSPLLAADIEESDARALVKKASEEYRKFKNKKISDYAPKAAIQAEKHLDDANKQIQEEEWEVAYYFAGKCLAYLEFGYARKKNKDAQAKLKALKERLK